MKSALVIGGAGFIGTHLLRALAASTEYDQLVSADIAAPRMPVPGVSYRSVDVQKQLPDNLCPQVGEIHNLAAIHTTPVYDDWEYFWTKMTHATPGSSFAELKTYTTFVSLPEHLASSICASRFCVADPIPFRDRTPL